LIKKKLAKLWISDDSEADDILSEIAKNLGWHGRISGQRALWQNIKNSQECTCKKDLCATDNIRTNFLYSWKTGRIVYMLTASPNWFSVPKNGFKGDSVFIDGMGDIPITYEKPLVIHIDTIRNITKFVKCLVEQGILIKSTYKCRHDLDDYNSVLEKVEETIRNKDIKEIKEKIRGAAGASTGLEPMRRQFNGVYKFFENFLNAARSEYPNENDDFVTSAALGYGMVSHALDTRHMLADMSGLKDGNYSLKDLLYNPPGPLTKLLLHIRLLTVLDLLEC